jgi:hypothetical protein
MNGTDYQYCCHCGQRHKNGMQYSIVISGKARTLCCPGCQAVANLIAHSQKIDGRDKRERH